MILFSALLRLFPSAFRRAFGEEMRRVFVELRRAAAQRGLRASAAFWRRTVIGMLAAAWHEHRDGRAQGSSRLPIFETFAADLRLILRMLLARPLFTLIVIAALFPATGIAQQPAAPSATPDHVRREIMADEERMV